MQTYAKFRPTQYDVAGLNLADRQDWLVAPCGTNRDADNLTTSNYQSLLKRFASAPRSVEDEDDYETHSFNHWGCGWFEIIIVRPGSECARIAEECEKKLEDYPILDEDHFSELETEDSFEEEEEEEESDDE